MPYGRRIKALSRAFSQAADACGAERELTCTQGMILGYLAHHNDAPVYPRDLERYFDLSHPTVSGLLQRMEAKGFIVRTPSERDRRCKCISMTSKALESRSAVRTRMEAMDAQLVQGFTAEEKRLFWALLCRAEKNVKATGNSRKKEADHAETSFPVHSGI